MYAEFHHYFLCTFVSGVILDGFEYRGQFISQEYGDNCGRCLVSAETMVVSCCRYGKTKEILIVVHCLDDSTEEKQELGVFVRRLARCQKVDSRVGCHRPVVVLPGSIYSGKRFLMKQAGHSMFACYLLHNLHRKLVGICSHIRRGIDRGKLVLCRGHFVVLCLCQNAKFPEFVVQVLHEG